MNLTSIKSHLRPYVIAQRRRTTINHAFASALAPCDNYDEARLREALTLLGQSDPNNLTCAYCGLPAETWDHLVGLVKNSELHGYGHQIGNLVPCCRNCNSRKGNRDWRAFLRVVATEPAEFSLRYERIDAYLQTYATDIELDRAQTEHPSEWRRYTELKKQILELMDEADLLASRFRSPGVSDLVSRVE